MNAVNPGDEMGKTAAGAAEEAGTAGSGGPQTAPIVPKPASAGAAPSPLPEEGPDPDVAPTFVVPPLDSSDIALSQGAPTATAAPGAGERAPLKAQNPPPREAAAPPQSKTGAELKKRDFPKPADLQPEKKVFSEIPSKVKLEDIQLPSYMKGVLSKPTPAAPKVAPEVERSIREIGIGPERPKQKTIVAIAADKRTEIDENGLPRIRTYAQDMSAEIKRRGATLSTIVGAEREREAERKARIDEQIAAARRRLMLVLGAVVIVFFGMGIVGAVLILTKEKEPVSVETSIIPENKKVVVELGKTELPRALANERSEAELKLGEMERLIVRDGIGELTPEALLTRLGAPAELARNADRVMVGLHAFDHTQPFIIIETRYYDLAFGAMLAWEPKMAKSLASFFAPASASTLPPELHFTDAIYKNIDVRKSEAAWPILYAFPEENLLVITTNVNTLSEILTRLSIAKTR